MRRSSLPLTVLASLRGIEFHRPEAHNHGATQPASGKSFLKRLYSMILRFVPAAATFALSNPACRRKFYPISAITDPSYLSCRISQNQGEIWNVFCHYSPSTHEGVSTNCMAADNCGISSNGCPTLDQGLLVFMSPNDVASRVNDVSKDH